MDKLTETEIQKVASSLSVGDRIVFNAKYAINPSLRSMRAKATPMSGEVTYLEIGTDYTTIETAGHTVLRVKNGFKFTVLVTTGTCPKPHIQSFVPGVETFKGVKIV